jgi:hypothetical protein
MLLASGAALTILGVAAFAFATPPSETGSHSANYALVIDPDATDSRADQSPRGI